MHRPRSRRALLTSAAATVAVATGGFEYASNATDTPPLESGTVSPDWYECSSVTRPEPTAPADDDALAPEPYPAPPSAIGPAAAHNRTTGSTSMVDRTVAYVTEFERAYRRNAFLAQYGVTTRTFELRRTDYRTRTLGSSPDPNAIMVAILYDLRMGTRQSATGPRDQWDVHTVYYVDEHVVLRALYNGVADELQFEPDPRTQGDLVACFD
ncbi:hypothetical protein ACFR99_17995 [Haloarchaeobius amylolyticus]|uniref:Uncharacterized protein n=1 Tax=Haloarchaeobius amylolyticus TaxID=1198296 RepID=A0ABD6BK07_9EURY